MTNKPSKYISYVVLILALAGVLAAGLLLITYYASNPPGRERTAATPNQESVVAPEVQLAGLRYFDVKNDDKTITRNFTTGNAQYRTAEQTYAMIDTTIMPTSGEYQYENVTNVFHSYFKSNGQSEDTIKYEAAGRSIAFSFVSANSSEADVESNMVTYPNILNGLDARYTVTNNRLLEELIAEETIKFDRVSQKINLAGAYYKEEGDGSISFHDQITKNALFTIPQPVLYEQNDKSKSSLGIHYEITEDVGGYIISKVLDAEGKEWLASAHYPVVIDFTVMNFSSASDMPAEGGIYQTTGVGGIGWWEADDYDSPPGQVGVMNSCWYYSGTCSPARNHYKWITFLSFDTSSLSGLGPNAIRGPATLTLNYQPYYNNSSGQLPVTDMVGHISVYSGHDRWEIFDITYDNYWDCQPWFRLNYLGTEPSSCGPALPPMTAEPAINLAGCDSGWCQRTTTVQLSSVSLTGQTQFQLIPQDDMTAPVVCGSCLDNRQRHIRFPFDDASPDLEQILSVTMDVSTPTLLPIDPPTQQRQLSVELQDESDNEVSFEIQSTTGNPNVEANWRAACIMASSDMGSPANCPEQYPGDPNGENRFQCNTMPELYGEGLPCTLEHNVAPGGADYLSPNTLHYYRARAVTSDGRHSFWSNVVSRYTLAAALPNTGLTVTSPRWNQYLISALPSYGSQKYCIGARFDSPDGVWPAVTPTTGTRYVDMRSEIHGGEGIIQYLLSTNPDFTDCHTYAEWVALGIPPVTIAGAYGPFPIPPDRKFKFGLYAINGENILTPPSSTVDRYSRARRPASPTATNINVQSMNFQMSSAYSDGFTKPATPACGAPVNDTRCGDINRSCESPTPLVNANDVAYLVQYIRNGTGSIDNWTADVNGDGQVNDWDIFFLVDALAGRYGIDMTKLNCGGANITNTAWTDYAAHETTTNRYINASTGLLNSLVASWWDFSNAGGNPNPNNWGGGNKNLTGLSVNTCYNFRTESRNQESIINQWSPTAQFCTLASVPGQPTVQCNYGDPSGGGGPSHYYCWVFINPGSPPNPNPTEYRVEYCLPDSGVDCSKDSAWQVAQNWTWHNANDKITFRDDANSWLTCSAGNATQQYRVKARNKRVPPQETAASIAGIDTLPPCPVSVNHYDNPVCRGNSYLDGWPEDPQCVLADPFDPRSEDESPVFWWWQPAISASGIRAYQVNLKTSKGDEICLAGIRDERFLCADGSRLLTEENYGQPWRELEWNEVPIPQNGGNGIIFKQFFQDDTKVPTAPMPALPNHPYDIIVRGVDNQDRMGAPSTLGVPAGDPAYTRFEQPMSVNLDIGRVNQVNRITVSTDNPLKHCDGEDFCNLTGLNNSGLQYKVVPVSEGGTEAPNGGEASGFNLAEGYKTLSVIDDNLSTNRRYCYRVRGYNGDCVDNNDDNICDGLNPVDGDHDATEWSAGPICTFTWANVPHAPRLIKQEGVTDTNVIIRSDDGNPHYSAGEPTNEAGANTRYAMCVTKYSATDQVDFRRYVSPTTGFLGSCSGYPAVSNETDCTSAPYNSTWNWNDSCNQPNSYLTTPEQYWSVRGSGTGNGWGGDDGILLTGLENSKYDFSFQARNGDKVPTQFGPAATLFLVRNNVVGWAWSSNAGWLSLNCLNMWANPTVYGYSCNSADEWGLNTYYVEGREYNPLEGYAWSGSGQALGGEWTEPENVSRVSNVHAYDGYPSLALDTFGNPHVAWANRAGGDRTDIYYLKKENGEWKTANDTVYVPGSTPSVNVTNTNALASVMPSLTVDSGGLPHLVWYEEAGGVFYLKWDTVDNRWETILGWDFATANIPANRGTSGLRISIPGNNGNNAPHLVLDKNNRPHVTYIYNYEIYYKYWDPAANSGNGAWVDANGEAGGDDRLNVSNTGVVANDCSNDPKLALSDEAVQRPYIVWKQSDPASPGCQDTGAVYLRRWDGANWVTISGDSAQGYNGANLHINYDVADYVEVDYPPDNYHAESPNLALDSQNRPGVVWRDPNDIFYKKWNGVRWVPTAVSASFPDLWVNYNTGDFQSASATGSALSAMQIAIAMKDDVPQISWGESAPGFRKEVVFRYWNQQHWTTISGAGNDDFVHRDDEDFSVSRTPQDASLAPSMSFDASGNPHIAWLEYTYDWGDSNCVLNGENGQTCCATNNDCTDNVGYPYCVDFYPDHFCSSVDINYSKWDQTPKDTGLGWVSLYTKVCKDDMQQGCFDDADCGGVVGSCQASAGMTPDGVTYGTCYRSNGEPYGVCSDNNQRRCTANYLNLCDNPATANCLMDHLESCRRENTGPAYGTCADTVEDTCKAFAAANFNGTTREIEGWARILSKKDEGVANGFNDWGWIHLNGNYDNGQGNAGTYSLSGTEVDSQDFLGDPDVNPNNVKLYSLFGWAWNSEVSDFMANSSWLPGTNVSRTGQVPNNQFINGRPAEVVDSKGNVHVAWLNRTADSQCTDHFDPYIHNQAACEAAGFRWNDPSFETDLYYLKLQSGRWLTAYGNEYVPGVTPVSELIVDGLMGDKITSSFSPSLAVDADDNPHIAWVEHAYGRYLRWDSTDRRWETITGVSRDQAFLDPPGTNFEFAAWSAGDPSLVLDRNDNPHIAYSMDIGGNNEIYYKYWDPSNTQLYCHGGDNNDLTCPQNDCSPGGGTCSSLWTNLTDVGGSSRLNVSNTAGWSSTPKLALSSETVQQPNIVWNEATGQIYFRKWSPTAHAWVTASGDTTQGSGGTGLKINDNVEHLISVPQDRPPDNNSGAIYPDLALYSNNQPGVAWRDPDEIFYRRWDTGTNSWVSASGSRLLPGLWVNRDFGTTNNTGNADLNSVSSSSLSLSIDRSDVPRISWQARGNPDQDLYSEIQYRFWNSTQWATASGDTTLPYDDLNAVITANQPSVSPALSLDSLGNANVSWVETKYGTQWCGAYDGDGEITVARGSAMGLAMDYSSGFMYVVGQDDTDNNSQWNWRIEKRRTDNGRLCTAGACGTNFGYENGSYTGNGFVRDNTSPSQRATEIVIDETYMYVVGVDDSPDWRLEKRRLDTGALCTAGACPDGNFGDSGSGIITISNTVGMGGANRDQVTVAIQNGYMYVGGTDSSNNWRLEKRRLDTGVLATDFGIDGSPSDPTGTDGTGVISVASGDSVQKIIIDGNYLFVGGSEDTSGTLHWRLEKRRLDTGALCTAGACAPDPDFGTDGVYISTNNGRIVFDLEIYGDSLYAGGYSFDTADHWLAGRFDKNSGSPDLSFDTDGFVEISSNAAKKIFELAVADYHVYLAGWTDRWLYGKIQTNGNVMLDPDFSGGWNNGFIGPNPLGVLRDMAIDSNYIYAVGDQGGAPPYTWRIEKRWLDTGRFDYGQSDYDCSDAAYALCVSEGSAGDFCSSTDINYTKWFPGVVQSGVGWFEFVPVGALLGIPYIQTQYSDIYAGQNIQLAPPPRGSGDYTSTYLILANGDIQGIPGYYAQTQTGLPTSQYIESGLSSLIGGSCTNTDYHTQTDCEAHLGTWTQGAGEPLGTQPLSRINITDLTTQVSGSTKNRFGQEVVTLDTGDLSAGGNHLGANPILDSKVYYVNGNASVDSSVITFMKGGSNTSGSGTIIINGNLEINQDIKYDDTDLDPINDNISDLPSAAIIVNGNIYVNSFVTQLSGVFVARDGVISTGRKSPISVSVGGVADDAYVTSTSVNNYTNSEIQFGKDAAGTTSRAFLRWPLDIPAGAEIAKAYIRFHSNGNGSADNFTARLYLVDNSDASSVDFTVPDLYNTDTSNSLSYPIITTDPDPSNITWMNTAGTWNQTPDIKSLVQRFVNLTDYQVGNYIGVVIKEDSGAANNTFRQFSGCGNVDCLNTAQLVVEYSPQRTIYNVGASGVDDVVTYTGGQNETADPLSFGWHNSRAERSVLRFSVATDYTPIPAQAEITKARLVVTENAASGADTFQARQGLLSPRCSTDGLTACQDNQTCIDRFGAGSTCVFDFATFQPLLNEYDLPLDQSVAEVSQDLSGAWTVGTEFRFTDIQRLIQSWVDRSYYTTGDHFGLRLRRGDNEATAPGPGVSPYRSFDDTSALVEIDYRAPLRVNGLFVAKGYNFDRKYLRNLAAAEQIVYDGRVVANTPPGLSDFIKALPVYQRVTP